MRASIGLTWAATVVCVGGIIGCANLECASDPLCALAGRLDGGNDANDSNAAPGDGTGVEGGTSDGDASVLDEPTGGSGSEAGDSACWARGTCYGSTAR